MKGRFKLDFCRPRGHQGLSRGAELLNTFHKDNKDEANLRDNVTLKSFITAVWCWKFVWKFVWKWCLLLTRSRSHRDSLTAVRHESQTGFMSV